MLGLFFGILVGLSNTYSKNTNFYFPSIVANSKNGVSFKDPLVYRSEVETYFTKFHPMTETEINAQKDQIKQVKEFIQNQILFKLNEMDSDCDSTQCSTDPQVELDKALECLKALEDTTDKFISSEFSQELFKDFMKEEITRCHFDENGKYDPKASSKCKKISLEALISKMKNGAKKLSTLKSYDFGTPSNGASLESNPSSSRSFISSNLFSITKNPQELFCGLLQSEKMVSLIKNRQFYISDNDFSPHGYKCEKIVLNPKQISYVIHPGGFRENLSPEDLNFIKNYQPKIHFKKDFQTTSDSSNSDSTSTKIMLSEPKYSLLTQYCGIFNSPEIKETILKNQFYFSSNPELKKGRSNYCMEIKLFIRKNTVNSSKSPFSFDQKNKSYIIDESGNSRMLKEADLERILKAFRIL